MRFGLPLLLSTALAFAQDGATVYKQRCASCHDAPAGRVPAVSALRAMSTQSILASLDSGTMKKQAEGLNSAERFALVGYLTSKDAVLTPLPATAFCKADKKPVSDLLQGPQWSAWGVGLTNTRFQDAAAAQLAATDIPKLRLKWAFGLGDAVVARAQPGVAGGRLYVGSQSGAVYSLNASSGCIYWTFEAEAAVRSGIVIGTLGSANRAAVYFGDQKANVYAVDAATGKLVWKSHVEEHFAAMITGSPQLHGDLLYVPVSSYEEALAPAPTYECCTFRGSVVALEAATGKQIWKTYTIERRPELTKRGVVRQFVEWLKSGPQMYGPSGAAVWSTPTVDEKTGALYIATGDNYTDPATAASDAVVALNGRSGKILWTKQITADDTFNNGCNVSARTNCPDAAGPDADFGQPPILVSLGNGRRALVIGQKSGIAHALDPDRQGELLWQTRVGKGGLLGGSQWGSAADGENMYVASSDLKLGAEADSAASQGFRLVLDPNQGGGLSALRLATGAKAWSAKPIPCGERKNCSPAQSAAVTAIPGAVFSGSVDGHLRAYAAATGEVIWDVDTEREYETVNGQKARGGSIDGPGPVIAGGMLYVNSGFGQWGGAPGNVLLAFSVDGR